jgi:hypothetical protein
MRIRTTAAAVLVAAAGTFALSGVAHAGPDERDCEDFSSQRQAQAVLDSADGNPARLDADGDGRACEIWFANHGGSGSGSDDAGGSAGAGAAANTDVDTEPSTDATTKADKGSSVGPAR